MVQDLYQYQKSYDRYVNKINRSNISKRNKELIFKFESDCLTIQKVAIPTRIKYLEVLGNLAKNYIKKDFNKMDREDFKVLISKINKEKENLGTQQKYGSILKKFGKWLAYGDKSFETKEYPELISFINTSIPRRLQKKIKANDILTEEEVKRLFEVAEHPRDKAFIYLLYESGSRIGEIGNLTIGDLHKDKYGYKVDLDGKTGRRQIRIILSTAPLTKWINIHPYKDNPNKPLWLTNREYQAKHDTTLSFKKGDKMEYNGLKKIVTRLVEKVGLKKRIHPHLFRHSRVTHLLRNKQINETQAKIYFGWSPSSDQIANYSHLVDSDIDDVMLEIAGVKKAEIEDPKIKARYCKACGNFNDLNAMICENCNVPMSVEAYNKVKEEENKMVAMLQTPSIKEALMKELIEKAKEEILKEKA